MKYNTISFCTVSMNRCTHIKSTLLKNIEENYIPNVTEFVLLDYNSSDGLEDWVYKNAMYYIDKGILKFYRNNTATFFHRAHARNQCLRLATSDIICNIDADNYMGK